MPNNVRIGTQVTGVGKSSSDLDNLKDKFVKLRAEGSKGFAIGAGAAATTAGLNAIGGAADAAASAVVGFAMDSIKAASDLNESTSKSKVIFGDAAKAVDDFAEHADKGLGLSKQAALEAAASFGNLFLGTGQTAGKAAELSKSMVTLAGDLASFNNLDPTETLEKLRSGLTGEAEPLRSVGVFLNEAKVKAKGMELGLADAHGEMSEGAKVMARYQIILDETKTAQGDFARTSDGLANSQRIANAELVNAEAVIGQKLLPVQLAFTRFMIDVGIPAIVTLGEAITNVGEPIGQFIELLGQAKDVLKDVGDTVPFVAGAFDLVGKAVTLPIQPLFFLKDRIDDLAGSSKALAYVVTPATQAVSDKYVEMAKTASAKADDLRESNKIAGNSFVRMADKAGDAATDVKTSFAEMTKAAGRWRHDLLSDAQKVVDDYYTVIIDQDQLAATNAEISAQRRIIASASSSKAEIADAKVRLHELERTQATLESELAEHGATTSGSFKKTMADLLKRLETAHGAERKAILAEITALELLAIKAKIANGKLLTLNETIAVTLAKGGYVSAAGAAAGNAAGGHPSGTGYASGGHYIAGMPRIVGEKGPEWDIPDHSGTIIPNGGSMGGSSLTAIPVPVPANWSPAMQQQFARDAAPYMIREFKRQGLIPR